MNPDISSTRISFSTVKHLPRFTVTNQLIVVLQAHRRVLVMTVQMIEALEAQKLNQFRRGLNILWDLRIFFHPTQKFLFFIFFSYISVVQILELSIVLLIEIPAHSSCCQQHHSDWNKLVLLIGTCHFRLLLWIVVKSIRYLSLYSLKCQLLQSLAIENCQFTLRLFPSALSKKIITL